MGVFCGWIDTALWRMYLGLLRVCGYIGLSSACIGSFAGVCKVNGVDVDVDIQASFAGVRGSFANLSRKRVLFCRWTEYVSACMHR